MTRVRRMDIDFVRPAVGDQAITITSFIREFQGPDALVECTMADAAGRTLSCASRWTNPSPTTSSPGS